MSPAVSRVRNLDGWVGRHLSAPKTKQTIKLTKHTHTHTYVCYECMPVCRCWQTMGTKYKLFSKGEKNQKTVFMITYVYIGSRQWSLTDNGVYCGVPKTI